MMRCGFLRFVGLLMVISALAVGCSDETGSGDGFDAPPGEGAEVDEDLPFEVVYTRGQTLNADDLDFEATQRLAAANSEAAFRLYRQIRQTEGGKSWIFSPFSLSRAFSNYYGADGLLGDAFDAVFDFRPENCTEEAWLDLTFLASHREPSNLEESERSFFESSDIYWVDREGMRGNFDRVHVLPFDEPEVTRGIINDWIEERSYGLLKDFLAPGVTEGAQAVTTNVVFFRGAWATKFVEAEPIAFQAASGIQDNPAFYGELVTLASVNEEATTLRVPYSQGYSLWVMMPHASLDDFADGLNPATFEQAVGETIEYTVSLTLPEFETKSQPDINAVLGEIRRETGTEGGTFSGAHIETVTHKAVIKVDREGTRAAAATTVTEFDNNGGFFPEPITITLDRPFVYIVADDASGSLLFMGEYTGQQATPGQ